MLAWVIILLILGLVALFKGADLIVDHASSLGAKLRLSVVGVGLTVVALAAVLPELTVAVMASARQAGDLIIGNALGATIFKIGAVLGIAALFNPISIHKGTLRHEVPFFFLYAVVIYFLGYDLLLTRQDGLILVLLAAVFVWYSIHESHQSFVSKFGSGYVRSHSWPFIFLGLALVVLGAKLFVDSSLVLAAKFGLSEFLIGILIVAIGTSAPELATMILASARHKAEVGVGNIIGSNVLHIFLVLGLAPLIQPIKIHPDLLIFDFPMVVFFAILVSLMLKTSQRLTRLEGAFLVAGYIMYFVYSIKFWG